MNGITRRAGTLAGCRLPRASGLHPVLQVGRLFFGHRRCRDLRRHVQVRIGARVDRAGRACGGHGVRLARHAAAGNCDPRQERRRAGNCAAKRPTRKICDRLSCSCPKGSATPALELVLDPFERVMIVCQEKASGGLRENDKSRRFRTIQTPIRALLNSTSSRILSVSRSILLV